MLFLTAAFLLGWCGLAPLSASAAEGDPRSALLEGLLACAEAVELSGYGLPTGELGALYAELLYGHPELFHVALRLSYTASDVSGEGGGVRLVETVYPAYTLTGEALAAARAVYRDSLSRILGDMEAAFGGRFRTEAETVLYLHDLLADRYAYDTRTASPNADAYTFFRDGKGICQAYALAFLALARGAGLEADLVTSEAMDHAWNHVRVAGVWYHVDVTRDDPIPAAEGREEVNHTRLLRSDAGMEALGYYGYGCTAGHTCADTRFETGGEAALAGFHGALTPVGESWIGEGEEGAPVAVWVNEKGITVGLPGDLNGDEVLTPADLLALYEPSCPEAWREWLREQLVR